MTSVFTPCRAALGDVSSTRLQGLANSKNRQSAIHERIKASLAIRPRANCSPTSNNISTPDPYQATRKRRLTPSPTYIDDHSDTDIGCSREDVDPCIWSPKRGKDNFGHAIRIRRAMRQTPLELMSTGIAPPTTTKAKTPPLTFAATKTPGAPRSAKFTPKLIDKLSPTTSTILRIAQANSGRKLVNHFAMCISPKAKNAREKQPIIKFEDSPIKLANTRPVPFALAKKALGLTIRNPISAKIKAAKIAEAADAIAARYASSKSQADSKTRADFQSMKKGMPFLIYEDTASEATRRGIEHDFSTALSFCADDIVMGDEDKENVAPGDLLEDTAALAANVLLASRARKARDEAGMQAGERGVMMEIEALAFAADGANMEVDLEMMEAGDNVNKDRMIVDMHAEARVVAASLGFSICEDAA